LAGREKASKRELIAKIKGNNPADSKLSAGGVSLWSNYQEGPVFEKKKGEVFAREN
jgi:hypothetical protein